MRFYTWDDLEYGSFMEKVLLRLIPYMAKKDSILFDELDEVSEILFISCGKVDIGFKVNSKPKFIIRFAHKSVLGAYHCTY